MNTKQQAMIQKPMTRNEFHLWLQTQRWADLTRERVENISDHITLGPGERLELIFSMDNIYNVFEDEASAAMAGCMFILGVTCRSIEDDWS